MTNRTRTPAASQATSAGAAGTTGQGGKHPSAVVPIDPAISRDGDSFPVVKQGAPSPWRDELDRMVAMVNADQLEVGAYYLIGRFNSAKGAGNRKAALDESTLLPALRLYAFDFKVSWPTPASSELWVALVPRSKSAA